MSSGYIVEAGMTRTIDDSAFTKLVPVLAGGTAATAPANVV